MFNLDIRKQHIIKKWGICVIKNRFRVLMGRWQLDECLCPMVFETYDMLVNDKWRQTGTCLVTLEPRMKRASQQEKRSST